MPRSARSIPEEGVFHVITRGNNRMDVFHGAEDYGKYLEILQAVRSQHPFSLYHYCLMTNHVHLILETKKGYPLSQIMKMINLTYALYHKRRYRHTGHFWQDRFKSLLIEKDISLLACGAYVELNPVKAGIVKDAGAYPYSSYSFYASGKVHNFMSPNPLYQEFGDMESVRRANDQAFVSSRLEDYGDFEKQVLSKRAFGSGQFLKALEETFKISICRHRKGRPKKILTTLEK